MTTGHAIKPMPGRWDEAADVRGRGVAGRLVMQWDDWIIFRAILAASTRVYVAEVEKPTKGQASHHVASSCVPAETGNDT